MTLLLSVETLNHPSLGALLDCWFVGGMLRPPFKPYCYSWEPIVDGVEFVRRVLLGGSERGVSLNEFASTLPFVQHVAIDHGFHVGGSERLRVLAFDVMTRSAASPAGLLVFGAFGVFAVATRRKC